MTFLTVQQVARSRGLILERRDSKSYDLDNRHGTCATCATLQEVLETMRDDSSFTLPNVPCSRKKTPLEMLATLINLHCGTADGGEGITDADWREANEILRNKGL